MAEQLLTGDKITSDGFTEMQERDWMSSTSKLRYVAS